MMDPEGPETCGSGSTTLVAAVSVHRFFLSVSVREIDNIRRGPTFGDFGTEASMQDVTVEDYRVQEYRLPSPPPFKCNVLRESLSVDSQNILCATLKRRGSWVISVYLWSVVSVNID